MQTCIKELREQKKITQTCLATHVGCSQNMISKIELGLTEPKAELLVEFSRYFNVSVDYILCNSKYKYLQDMYISLRNVQEEYFAFLQNLKRLSDDDRKMIYSLIDRLAGTNIESAGKYSND